MTKIYIKGALAKKFGNFFEMNVHNALSALKAIDANRNGFMKELFDLSKNNIEYILICNEKQINNSDELIEKRKIKTIYIVPAIIGSGVEAAVALGMVTASGALTAGGMIVAGLVNGIISMAISLAVSFLTASLNKQAAPPQQNIAIGGTSAMIEAKGKSYIFSNRENLAQQGSSVSVGYGLMKIASNVISASIRSYPTNEYYSTEFDVYNSQFINLTS